IESTMLNRIQSLLSLSGDISQPHPDQDGTSDRVPLNACLTTLAAFQSSQRLGFTVKRLNFPTQAAHFWCVLSRMLRSIVGHDPVRAVLRHLNPEPFHGNPLILIHWPHWVYSCVHVNESTRRSGD